MTAPKINIFIISLLLSCLLSLWQTGVSQAKPKNSSRIMKSSRSTDASPIMENRRWGLGLIIGDPTGLTVKYWGNKHVAYEFALGSQLAAAGISIHADYLYHMYLFREAPEMPLYLGGGVFMAGFTDEVSAGGRGVVGLTYLFEDAPFDVFMQLSPNLILAPEIGFSFSFSIGARIYI